MSFPLHRPRRLRRTETIRRMVRETRLSPEMFVAPLFVCEGEGVCREIGAMPGCFNMSVDVIVEECRALWGAGVPAVILFGVPDEKDAQGAGAADPQGPVPRALTAIRPRSPGCRSGRTSASANTRITGTAARWPRRRPARP